MKELEIRYSDQVKEKIAEDPEMADFLRDFSACARQAMQGVQDGKYKDFDDAMEAITGNRPVKIADEEDGF